MSTSEVEDSSAVSALPVALSLEPDEAICEAAYAVGTPEELMRCLASWRQHNCLRQHSEWHQNDLAVSAAPRSNLGGVPLNDGIVQLIDTELVPARR